MLFKLPYKFKVSSGSSMQFGYIDSTIKYIFYSSSSKSVLVHGLNSYLLVFVCFIPCDSYY